MKNHVLFSVMLITLSAGLMTSRSEAQTTVIAPTSATSSTAIDVSRTITTVIDSSDLSGGGTSGDILTETHDPSTDKAGYWLSGSGAGTAPYTEVLVFDLGGTFNVSAIHLWSYDRGEDNPTRAIKDVDISFSTDGGSTYGNKILGTELVDFGMPADVGRVNGEIPVQSRTFSNAVSGVTHVKLDNIINYGNDYIGISELRFGIIPPPAGTVIVIK